MKTLSKPKSRLKSMKVPGLKQVPAALQYLRYKLVSSDAHGLHSPFVFELYNNTILDETPFYFFRVIESIRANMLLSNEEILVHDLGTGGKKLRQKNRSISYIAKHFVKPAKYGQLLFRLINKFQPEYILELGTSLGITTLYLASSNSKSRVTTIEGCPNTAAMARKNFAAAGIKNIQLLTGEFSDILPGAVQQIPRLDFVYFDGNHRKDATLAYFRECLAKHHERSVFVFDDIHWSNEMNSAWKTIQLDQEVTVTIDLFSVGLVFFRKGLPKQHFVLKF
jgi:predicted O-methyltransferase YrrM